MNFRLLKNFSNYTLQIRQFFHQRDFLEAQTPSLVVCPGTEPYLDVFSTELIAGQKRKKLYLPTSPEISLKKMICQGSGPVFEIKNVFRNNELGEHHEPEFLMLEWYRIKADLSAIQKDVIELVQTLSGNSNLKFQSFTMADLFRTHLDFQLTPSTTRQELLELAKKNSLHVREDDTLDEIFTLLFVEKIEPNLNPEMPTFVTDYPPFQAAYARLNSSGWADRFEFYWHGLEIANAFYELTDAELQRQRMFEDNNKKKKIGKEVVALDEEFLTLMKKGMPQCSGIALGVERLFMALYHVQNIRELKPLSPMRD